MQTESIIEQKYLVISTNRDSNTASMNSVGSDSDWRRINLSLFCESVKSDRFGVKFTSALFIKSNSNFNCFDVATPRAFSSSGETRMTFFPFG